MKGLAPRKSEGPGWGPPTPARCWYRSSGQCLIGRDVGERLSRESGGFVLVAKTEYRPKPPAEIGKIVGPIGYRPVERFGVQIKVDAPGCVGHRLGMVEVGTIPVERRESRLAVGSARAVPEPRRGGHCSDSRGSLVR